MQKSTPLQALFRYRSVSERTQWLRLHAAHGRLNLTSEKLSNLEKLKDDLQQLKQKQLRTGIRGCELVLISSSWLVEKICRANQELTAAKEECERQDRAYLQARGERKMVENALARFHAECEAENKRKEQLALDDQTLQRFSRRDRKFT
jgi:flagellar export protein FliJ